MVQEGSSGTIFSEFLGPESLASSEFTRDSVIVPLNVLPADYPCSGTERIFLFWILCGSLSSDLAEGWIHKQPEKCIGREDWVKKSWILHHWFPPPTSHLLLAHFTCTSNWMMRKIYLLSSGTNPSIVPRGCSESTNLPTSSFRT